MSNFIFKLVFVFLLNFLLTGSTTTTSVVVDDTKALGRTFDGIGAVSGGGATSKLLPNYPEKERNEILDYLFKPNHLGALQILKVEIGGDSQSTDGSESSHMHSEGDEDYNRGYEWWLMKEAKKRNPGIKLYGLPWVFPGWLGGGSNTPYKNITKTVTYVMNWIKGAKKHHNLDIDYIGVWNERAIDPEYVKLLRHTLNQDGLPHIEVVVPDAMSWSILEDFKRDPSLLDAVDIIGQHYPGSKSERSADVLKKKYWSSEDFSTLNDLAGGGCWARILNEGVVMGFYTSFIAWNMVTSYYDGLPYTHCSLMSANQPWSGHYVVDSPLWMTAHHTNFYKPGDTYLGHGAGVGALEGGGFYISVTNENRKELTIVLETVTPKEGVCLYPAPIYDVIEEQDVTISLRGAFTSIKELFVWKSHLNYKHPDHSTFMQAMQRVKVTNGVVYLKLYKNQVYTLTTVAKEPINPPTPPKPSPFPVPYSDDFEAYPLGSEAYNLAQQMGSFEVTTSGDPIHNHVVTQMVTMPPIDTCQTLMPRPFVLVGNQDWYNTKVKLDAYISASDATSSGGVFVASQVRQGGCDGMFSSGYHFFVDVIDRKAMITANHNRTVLLTSTKLKDLLVNQWFTMTLDVMNGQVTASINNRPIMHVHSPKATILPKGFVTFGPYDFGRASFDNLAILRAHY